MALQHMALVTMLRARLHALHHPAKETLEQEGVKCDAK